MTKDIYLKKLGKHIKKLREKAGLTQSKLAENCDKERQNIYRLEKGEMNPTAYYLTEIAEGLGVEAKELLDFK
jgi:putative transcriptional regulator